MDRPHVGAKSPDQKTGDAGDSPARMTPPAGQAGSPAEATPAAQGQDAALTAANKRLRIVTRCGTLEEFFATFGAFADESSLFIVTNKPRPLGLKQPFIIQLRDGETILRGDVEVIESITDNKGPDGRNGMRLKLLNMDDATRDVLRRLLDYTRAARSVAPPAIDDAPLSTAVPSDQRPGAPRKPPPPPKPGPPAERTSAPTTSSPALEERAPGAAYQLPANPFEGITAEALESFVECTLYEEREPAAEALATGSFATIASVAAPPPSVMTGSFGMIPPPPPGAPTFGAPPAAAPTFGSPPAAAPKFGAPPAAAPTFVTPPPGTSPGATSQESGPMRDAVLIAAAIQAANGPKRRPWIFGVGVTAIVSSIASLGLAYFFWGRAPSDPASGQAQTASVPSAVPTVDRTATVASSSPSATASAAPSAAPNVPPVARDCLINVRSYPLGAAVRWNGESIGNTPLADTPVPCGQAKVTFELQGYELGEKGAQAIVGRSGGVFIRLTPIRVAVEITSTPPGAQITVDGRSMGRTPTNVSVVGLRETTFMVKHPNFKPWMKTLTPEPPKVSVHADLEPK